MILFGRTLHLSPGDVGYFAAVAFLVGGALGVHLAL